jgi:hypothetical protein
MKVLDLACTQGHGFEGWFASEDDFQGQLARAMISCPLCADTRITKKLSAPRLNLSTNKPSLSSIAQPSTDAAESIDSTEVLSAASQEHQMQAAWLQMVRHVITHTEDVGDKFATEARKMHYGEAEHRNIRGQASPEQTKELLDEGIGVLPLPIPEALKEPLQ